jgi:hypothetical protein
VRLAGLQLVVTSEELVRQRMRFISPEGRGEVVWVERQPSQYFRVCNVPAWMYGLSLGALVSGRQGAGEILEYEALVEPSIGGTVRCVVPKGNVASHVYLERIVSDARKRGYAIGPSTFVDPRMVAIHLHARDSWPIVGQYLDGLVTEGIIQYWEVGDPDQEREADDPPTIPWTGRDMIHPEPTSDVAHLFTI